MRIRYSHEKYGAKLFESPAAEALVGRPSRGRRVDLDLTPDANVSRQHARLTYANGEYWIEDLNSRSGTWVNDSRIAANARVRLRPGDKVRLGQTTLEVEPESHGAAMKAKRPAALAEAAGPEGALTSSVSAAEQSPDLLLADKASKASVALARRRLRAFCDLGAALATADALDPLLKTVVEHLLQAIPTAQRAGLLLCEGDGLLLKAHAPAGQQASASLTLARRAVEQREAFTWQFGAPAGAGESPPSVLWHGTQWAMYAPLIWKAEALGVAYVDSSEVKGAFADDDLRLLMAMANQAALCVRNYSLQAALREEAVIKSNLLRQFSPKIAKQMLARRGRLRLGGERVLATILCSDVRGFTALAAKMEPDEVVKTLDEAFDALIPIVFKYDGTVDKYVGDSILAVFGSPEPDPAQWEHALRAALEMQSAMKELSGYWHRQGRPVFEIGIGVHTGDVLHGFIGAQERMEFTVIGDAVNRAARYCDGAEKGEVLISDDVYGHVFRLADVSARTVRTKHPDTEGDLPAYLVNGLRADPAHA